MAKSLYHGCGIPEDQMDGDSILAKRQLIADRSKEVVAVFATPDFASAGLFAMRKGDLYDGYSIGDANCIIGTGLIASGHENFTEPLIGRVYEFTGDTLDRFVRTVDECYHEGNIKFNDCIIHRDITLEKLMSQGVQIFRAKLSAQQMYDLDQIERRQGNTDTPEQRTQVRKQWIEKGYIEHMNPQFERALVFDFETNKLVVNNPETELENIRSEKQTQRSQTFCEMLASCFTGKSGR